MGKFNNDLSRAPQFSGLRRARVIRNNLDRERASWFHRFWTEEDVVSSSEPQIRHPSETQSKRLAKIFQLSQEFPHITSLSLSLPPTMVFPQHSSTMLTILTREEKMQGEED
jgi:hypothetical protein